MVANNAIIEGASERNINTWVKAGILPDRRPPGSGSGVPHRWNDVDRILIRGLRRLIEAQAKSKVGRVERLLVQGFRESPYVRVDEGLVVVPPIAAVLVPTRGFVALVVGTNELHALVWQHIGGAMMAILDLTPDDEFTTTTTPTATRWPTPTATTTIPATAHTATNVTTTLDICTDCHRVATWWRRELTDPLSAPGVPFCDNHGY